MVNKKKSPLSRFVKIMCDICRDNLFITPGDHIAKYDTVIANTGGQWGYVCEFHYQTCTLKIKGLTTVLLQAKEKENV